MKIVFSLVISLVMSFVLSYGLVVLLPGTFESDEVQLVSTSRLDSEMHFGYLLKQYISGNWGQSWLNPELSVLSLITTSISMTLGLQLMSFSLILVISFLLSYFLVLNPEKAKTLMRGITLVASLPILFWLPALLFILSFQWQLLPYRFDTTWQSWLLPVLGLSLRPLCISTLILSQSWMDTRKTDYMRTARAKGLSMKQALLRHGLKNSSLAYSSQVLQVIAQLLTGSVLIETLFSWPGLGTLFIEALKSRDLPVLLASVFVMTGLYLGSQILVGGVHQKLEPRLRT